MNKEKNFRKKSIILIIVFLLTNIASFQLVLATETLGGITEKQSFTSDKTKKEINMKWISSGTLLKKQPFVDLSTVDKKDYEHVWSSNTISQDAGWKLHKGDVTIEGSLDNNDLLLVDGNLTIKGTYDDYKGSSSGHLIVLGDFYAENILSNNDIYVAGKLKVKDLIYTYYNDFAFSVDGGVYGKGLIVSDKSGGYSAEEVGFEIHTYHESFEQLVLAMRSTAPEIWLNPDFVEEGVDTILYMCEDKSAGGTPDLKMVTSIIDSGKPIIREKQAPVDVIEKICTAMSPETSEAAFPELMDHDPLVQYALATRTDLSEKLYQRLESSKDPNTRAILITHRKVDEGTDVSGLSAHEAKVLAEREDLSDTKLTQLAQMVDIQVLEVLARREDLPVPVLVDLVNKNNDSLTYQTISSYDNGFRLPSKTKQMLLQSKNEDIRSALIFCDLNETEMLMLVREGNEKYRRDLAQRLVQQAEQKRPTSLDSTEIHNVADHLVKLGVLEAIPALPEQRQLEAVLQQKSISRHDGNNFARATTTSKPLMEYILEKATKLDIFENLAQNPSLPDDLQLRLLKRGLEEVQNESDWNDILENLLENSNISDEVLRYASKYLIEHGQSNDMLFSYIINCSKLPSDVLLSMYKNCREAIDEDWYSSILEQENATMFLVKKALINWHEENKYIIEYLKKISTMESKEWWQKLAESPFYELHDVASLNRATDRATLLKLLHDKEKDTFAATNPALSSEDLIHALSIAHKKGHNGLFDVINNPNFPIEKLRNIANDGTTYESRSRAREALALRFAKARFKETLPKKQ